MCVSEYGLHYIKNDDVKEKDYRYKLGERVVQMEGGLIS